MGTSSLLKCVNITPNITNRRANGRISRFIFFCRLSSIKTVETCMYIYDVPSAISQVCHPHSLKSLNFDLTQNRLKPELEKSLAV